MDLSHDEVRREAREIQAEHDDSLPGWRRALSRIFGGDDAGTPDDRADLVLGGMTRRRLFQIGGLTVASAAIIAACGDDSSGSSTTTAGSAATTTAAAAGDAAILRTASSIEELAVAAYQTAIDSGLVKTMAVADAAKLFQSQHKEHSALFQSATKTAGGQPFAQPNPVILAALKPTIDALKDEMGVLKLAYDLEVAAAQTYQADVGTFKDPSLNTAIMSVGGVEARHAALLATVLGQAAAPKAFQTTEMAVKAGTGV